MLVALFPYILEKALESGATQFHALIVIVSEVLKENQFDRQRVMDRVSFVSAFRVQCLT